MAKGIYTGVSGIPRNAKEIYVGVGGVPRKVKEVYVGVGGVPRLSWSAELTASVSSSYGLTITTNSNGSKRLYGDYTGYNSGHMDIVFSSPIPKALPVAVDWEELDESGAEFIFYCSGLKTLDYVSSYYSSSELGGTVYLTIPAGTEEIQVELTGQTPYFIDLTMSAVSGMPIKYIGVS